MNVCKKPQDFVMRSKTKSPSKTAKLPQLPLKLTSLITLRYQESRKTKMISRKTYKDSAFSVKGMQISTENLSNAQKNSKMPKIKESKLEVR